MFTKKHKSIIFSLIIMFMAGSFSTVNALNYRSYFYNIYDSIIFSYEDSTDIEIYRGGQLRWSGQLDTGEHHLFQIQPPEPKRGVFEVRSSSRKLSILSGDMVSRGISGYYAVEPYGRGVHTELYTYVPVESPNRFYTQKFVVFAYQNDTELTVEYEDPNGIYHEVVKDHLLNSADYWQTEDLSGEYVHLTANKPVSALSCYDTGYFVPSADGNRSKKCICSYAKSSKPIFSLT